MRIRNRTQRACAPSGRWRPPGRSFLIGACINAEGGAVFLRGQLESAELIDEVANAVRKIRGVEEVVNLFHLPGTEAPHPPPKLTQAP